MDHYQLFNRAVVFFFFLAPVLFLFKYSCLHSPTPAIPPPQPSPLPTLHPTPFDFVHGYRCCLFREAESFLLIPSHCSQGLSLRVCWGSHRGAGRSRRASGKDHYHMLMLSGQGLPPAAALWAWAPPLRLRASSWSLWSTLWAEWL